MGKSPYFPDIKPDSKFFVFDTLMGPDQLPGAKETYLSAQTQLQKTIDIVKVQTSQAEVEMENGKTVTTALGFLQTAYNKELETEKNFYKDRLLNNPNIPEEYQYEIKSLIEDEAFDYYRFMNILKEIELGKEKWKKELEDMRKQITDFNKAMDLYNTKYREGKKFDPRRVKDEEEYKHQIGILYNDPDIAYRAFHPATRQALGKSHALHSAALGGKPSEVTSKLMKLLRANMDALIGGAKITLTPNQKSAFLANAGLALLEEVYSMCDEHSSDVINYNAAERLIELLNNGEDENNTLESIHVQNLRKKCNQLLKSCDILEQIGEQSRRESKNIVKYNSKTNNITNLNQSVRKRITAFLDDTELTELGEKKFNGKGGKANKEAFVAKLREVIKQKQKSNNEFAQILSKSLNNSGLAKSINTILATNSTITMYAQTEHGAALTEKNFYNYITRLVGNNLGKADIIGIGEAIAEYEVPDDQEELILNTVMDVYEQAYKEAYEQELKKIQHTIRLPVAQNPKTEEEKQAAMYAVFGTDKNNKNFYSSRADAYADKTATKAMEQKLNELLADYNKKPTGEEKKYNLSELFKIETSVKFSDYIFNDLGFQGGTLGSTLFEQLDNLNFIAEELGMEPMNTGALTFAILNSGEGMVGAQFAPSLEQYLGIFASMLMFRTSQELIEQVNIQIKNIVKPTTSTMHLYVLNNIYVPSSFILKTLLDGLTNALEETKQEQSNMMGMQLQIINPVTVNDIVKGPPTGGYTQRGQMWYETAATNLNKVSLSGRIMAGFNDMLGKIQSAMNQH